MAKFLLAEDNEGDSRLIQEAFQKVCPEDQIVTIKDGAAVLPFLKEEHGIDLVILDLNLPKRDGLEILMEVRKDAKLKSLPVIILTTSQWKADRYASRLFEADAFFIKPSRFSDFLKLVERIKGVLAKKA